METLLDAVRRKPQGLSANGRFQGFQIQVLHTLAAQQCFHVPQDLSSEEAVERGFFKLLWMGKLGCEVADRRSARKQRQVAGPVPGTGDTPPPAAAFCSRPVQWE